MLLKVVILLSCVAIYTKCARLRVVGGKECTTRYPFMASLQSKRKIVNSTVNSIETYQFAHRCGASIIRNDCIVTAAHCVDKVLPGELSIFVGTNDLDDPSGERYYVRDIVMHSQYFEMYENDIAVLRLSKRLQFSDQIGPITVSKEFVDGGIKLLLPGWGLSDRRKLLPSPRKLQELNTTSITNKECGKNGLYEPSKTDLCCIEPGNGASNGDSGGPLVKFEGETPILAGIVSRGFMISATPSFPDLYTRASLYVDWINEQCDK